MSGTYADPDWANPGESTGGEVTESVPAASGNAAKQPTAGGVRVESCVCVCV